MNDISLALFTGVDIPMVEYGLILHQPTIKEISYIGEARFLSGIQLLGIQKDALIQDKEQADNVNIFQIILQLLKENQELKNNILNIFQLLFINIKVIIMPKSINFIQADNNIIMIDENNFQGFQDYLRTVFCLTNKTNNDFNTVTEKGREIANKLLRARQRVAAQKQQGKHNTLVNYLSSLVVAIPSMSLNDVINLTLYQLYDLLERYSLYSNWDLQIKCQLAGGTVEEKEDWMKNIH